MSHYSIRSLLHVCIFVVDNTVYVKPIEPSPCSSRQQRNEEEEKKQEEEEKKDDEEEKSEGKLTLNFIQKVVFLSLSLSLSLYIILLSNNAKQ